MDIFDKALLAWLAVGIVFWTIYSALVVQNAGFIYYVIWVAGFGGFGWLNREKIAAAIRSLPGTRFSKFVALGFGTVLLEETFAALPYAISEGFTIMLYAQRILQHWAFNLFTFTGFVFGWYFLLSRYGYSGREVFLLAGIWGLYAESVIYSVFTNPLAFFIFTPVMVFTYGLIAWPPFLSFGATGSRQLHPALKYPLTMLALYLFSVVPILVLGVLLNNYPWAFAPYMTSPTG
ncbi:hypothetical protein KJ765_00885 [Candidatus Micrarchaeota archaeon]|nr:hypothetical protein [Candidatus Micrarchaeota archaeon]